MNGAVRPKIGLLGLTLELYEKLAPGLRPDRENWLRTQVIPALEPKTDVLFEQAVFRKEEIETVVEGYESQHVDALAIVFLTYAPSQLVLPALQRTRLPLVIWNTQELLSVNETFSPVDLRNNHGVHGTQDLGNVLLRCGVPFHYVTGHLNDADAVDELGDLFAAAAAVRRLRQGRFGLIGYPFPGMGDFAVDTTQMAAKLGCAWTSLPVEGFIKRAGDADPRIVEELVGEYRSAYAVGQDVTADDLGLAAGAELALRGMVADERLDGLSYQFLAFGEDERTSTLPFIGISRMMAEGTGFGGEGDILSAAATSFFNWLAGPVTFSEIFTIDFAGNGVLMSHMGEANVAMARKDRKIRLMARPTPIARTRGRQLALVTALEPGPSTLATLTLGPGGSWRVIASQVSIEDFGPLNSLAVPHFKVKPAKDVRDWLTAYARVGGPHHNAVCFGDARRRLRLAAGLLGAEYHEV